MLRFGDDRYELGLLMHNLTAVPDTSRVTISGNLYYTDGGGDSSSKAYWPEVAVDGTVEANSGDKDLEEYLPKGGHPEPEPPISDPQLVNALFTNGDPNTSDPNISLPDLHIKMATTSGLNLGTFTNPYTGQVEELHGLKDIDNKTRIFGDSIDIGADEIQ